jgi:hypothetical protein
MNPVSYAAQLYFFEPQCYSRDTILQGVLWACANTYIYIVVKQP